MLLLLIFLLYMKEKMYGNIYHIPYKICCILIYVYKHAYTYTISRNFQKE